jgi:uncharacterized protein (TIGR02271 family)
MSSSTVTNTGTNQLVAFFPDREDAYKGIDELRNAGFTNNEIGLAFQDEVGDAGTSGKSTWQKIKDFFTGSDEEDTAYRGDVGVAFHHYNLSDEQSQYYRSGIGEGGAVVTLRATVDRIAKARNILQKHDADFRNAGFDRSRFTTAGTEADQRLQLRGEMLRTYKDRVAKGEVRLRKEVVSENRSVDVPFSREEVVIERVSANEARPMSGKVADIGQDQEIRIPVSEERVRVEKEPVVTGEVRVGKRAVQDTQKVSDAVRREELRIEKEGDVNVDESGAKRKKPAA